MKLLNISSVALFLLLLVIGTTGCSKKDSLANASHTTSVFSVGVGIQRLSDIKIFMSEAPFQSYDKFTPITSISRPEKFTIQDSLVFNTSNYVGKTLYFVALRKYLLSDKYYNVTNASKGLAAIKADIQQDIKHTQVALVVSDPASGSYVPDKAAVALTVKKGSAAVANREVYYYGQSSTWTTQMKALVEKEYKEKGRIVGTLMAKTNASGLLNLSIPVNELGVIKNAKGDINYNEHVFFVLDNGSVKDVKINVNALQMNSTLQY